MSHGKGPTTLASTPILHANAIAIEPGAPVAVHKGSRMEQVVPDTDARVCAEWLSERNADGVWEGPAGPD